MATQNGTVPRSDITNFGCNCGTSSTGSQCLTSIGNQWTKPSQSYDVSLKRRDGREKRQSASRERQNSGFNQIPYFAFLIAAMNLCLKRSESRRMLPSQLRAAQPTQ